MNRNIAIRNEIIAGHEDKNVFVAVDSLDNELGRCKVERHMNAHIMPQRPLELCLKINSRPESRQRLLAAAMARAMLMARQESLNARIYTHCSPDDFQMLELLDSMGFDRDDMIVCLHRRVLAGPNTVRLPDNCVMIIDTLNDPPERKFFLERMEKLNLCEAPQKWLDEARLRQGFRRMLIAGRDGLAGEIICWNDQREGVIGHIYTAPAWRKKGIASYLTESARQYFHEHHLNEIKTDVRWRMTAARNLFSSAGYRHGPDDINVLLPGIDLDNDR